MNLSCYVTVRTECRICGCGMERPVTTDGLCLLCAVKCLTKRQKEILQAYRANRLGSVPDRIKSYINNGSNRASAVIRVLKRLEELGYIQCDLPNLYLIGSQLTRIGYNALKRLDDLGR